MANSEDRDPPDQPMQIECFPEVRSDRSEPPPGKKLICRPYITRKDGQRIYASSLGKKAFCFYVDEERPHV